MLNDYHLLSEIIIFVGCLRCPQSQGYHCVVVQFRREEPRSTSNDGQGDQGLGVWW